MEIAQGTPYASIYPCSGIITPYSLPRSRLQLSRLMVPECSRSLLKRERHDGLGHVFDTEGIHIHIFSPRNGVELISRGAWEKNGSLGIAIHLTQPRKDRRCFATEKNTSPGLAQAFPVSKNIGKQHPRRFPACHTNVPCLTTMHPLVSSSSGVAAKVLTTGDLMVASTTDPGPNGPNVAPGHQIRLRWPFAFRFQRWQHDLRDVAQT